MTRPSTELRSLQWQGSRRPTEKTRRDGNWKAPTGREQQYAMAPGLHSTASSGGGLDRGGFWPWLMHPCHASVHARSVLDLLLRRFHARVESVHAGEFLRRPPPPILSCTRGCGSITVLVSIWISSMRIEIVCRLASGWENIPWRKHEDVHLPVSTLRRASAPWSI